MTVKLQPLLQPEIALFVVPLLPCRRLDMPFREVVMSTFISVKTCSQKSVGQVNVDSFHADSYRRHGLPVPVSICPAHRSLSYLSVAPFQLPRDLKNGPLPSTRVSFDSHLSVLCECLMLGSKTSARRDAADMTRGGQNTTRFHTHRQTLVLRIRSFVSRNSFIHSVQMIHSLTRHLLCSPSLFKYSVILEEMVKRARDMTAEWQGSGKHVLWETRNDWPND